MSIEDINSIIFKGFRKEIDSYLILLDTLTKNIENIKYTYMGIDDFQKLLISSLPHAMKVYWSELIGRAHFACMTSTLRLHRWVTGMTISAYNNNFLLFATSFRGLIEAAADTYDALSQVPLTLAESYKSIKSALNGELSSQLLASGELEDKLIHYSHGRSMPRSVNCPESHKAKPTKDYLQQLQSSSSVPIIDCYAQLCNITHPAHLSVYAFVKTDNDEKVFNICQNTDIDNIKVLCSAHSQIIPEIFMLSINPILLTLKTINLFQYKKFYTYALDSVGLDSLMLWQEISSIITCT